MTTKQAYEALYYFVYAARYSREVGGLHSAEITIAELNAGLVIDDNWRPQDRAYFWWFCAAIREQTGWAEPARLTEEDFQHYSPAQWAGPVLDAKQAFDVAMLVLQRFDKEWVHGRDPELSAAIAELLRAGWASSDVRSQWLSVVESVIERDRIGLPMRKRLVHGAAHQ